MIHTCVETRRCRKEIIECEENAFIIKTAAQRKTFYQDRKYRTSTKDCHVFATKYNGTFFTNTLYCVFANKMSLLASFLLFVQLLIKTSSLCLIFFSLLTHLIESRRPRIAFGFLFTFFVVNTIFFTFPDFFLTHNQFHYAAYPMALKIMRTPTSKVSKLI